MVADHEGEWGWYKIEMTLSMRGSEYIHVPNTMIALINDGLITSTGDVQSATTRYSLTDKGREMIKFLETEN
jgi:hypothetical protein